MSVYRKTKTGLPNPFRTYSNFVYPRTMKDVLVWASYLWERNASYRTSIQKVVSYFVSDIKVVQGDDSSTVDTDAINAFKSLLVENYGMLQLVLQFGEELAAMGNVFVSAERVFTRELVCPTDNCGWQMRLKSLRKGVDYNWDGKNFVGKCPKCGKRVKWKINDSKTQDPEGRRIRFVFRSAEDMQVQFNRLTGTYCYLYKLPEDIATAIRRGDRAYLEDSPQVFIEAAVKGEPYIEFPPDMFYAARTHTLSNMDRLYKGWGLPLFMTAFDNIVRQQHLDKFNEAVMFDYIIPRRIISPAPQNLQAGIDANRMPMSGSAWCNMMSTALRGGVANPTQWVISPVPVQQQQVGGDKSVIPTEYMEYEKSQMQEDIGLPQEMRQTNFQVVAPTMGLRMFERRWVHFGKSLGGLVKWAGNIVAAAHQYEDMKCGLDMTSFVEDDLNRQTALMLMQGGVIAKTPILKRLGIDFEDDLKMQMKEQKMQADAAAEQQKAQQSSEMGQSVMPPAGGLGIGQAQMNIQMMQQQAQGGEGMPGAPAQPGQPGQPVGVGGGGLPFNQGASESASIEQLFQQAQAMAQELYAAPPNIRRAQLVNLKATNPQLHAMVKQQLVDMEQQVSSDAVAQSKQPQG